jgi:hypothetical protein
VPIIPKKNDLEAAKLVNDAVDRVAASLKPLR